MSEFSKKKKIIIIIVYLVMSVLISNYKMFIMSANVGETLSNYNI